MCVSHTAGAALYGKVVRNPQTSKTRGRESNGGKSDLTCREVVKQILESVVKRVWFVR